MSKYQLSADQTNFLQQFIVGKSFLSKRKITSGYTDYCRREGKVIASLDKVQPGSEARQSIERDLQAAQTMKDAGNFKEAYKALNDVKRAAYAAGKSAEGVAAGIDPGSIVIDIGDLETDLDAVWQMANDYRDDIARVRRAAAEPVPVTMDAAAIRDETAQMQLLVGGFANRAAILHSEAVKVAAPVRIDRLSGQLDTLERAGTAKKKGSVAQLRGELAEMAARNRFDDATLWEADFAAYADGIDQALAAWEASAKVATPQRDAFAQIREGVALKPVDTAALEAREARRIDLARAKMAAAFARDAALSGADPVDPLAAPRLKPTELRRFQADDLDIELADDAEPAAVEKAATKAAGALAAKMADEYAQSADSDVVFDLMLKNEQDFAAMVADSLGWPADRSSWSDAQVAAAAAVGARLRAQVQASAKNTVSDDGQTLTMNGKTYTKDEKLGSGSFGDITRYVADDKSKIVMKSLLAGHKRAEMITELEMHRRAMGGENGRPHPNVVPLKGVALGKDGMLTMLMDEAEGGDARQLNGAMLAAQESGVLSKEGRDALARNMFLQMAEGMKRVHDANMTHNDIKAANFLVAADGTVQVADFGSGRETDGDGANVTEETKAGKAAREKKLAEVQGEIAQLRKQMGGPGDGGNGAALTERLEDLLDQEEILGRPGLDAYALAGMKDPSDGQQTKGGDPQSTMKYRALQIRGKKADVFMLGAMLDVLTRDVQELEGGVYFNRSRQTGHDATSLDRLRNRMLDPDEAKRPSLDAVLGSAYLEQTDAMVDQIQALERSFSSDAPEEDRGYDGFLNQLGRNGPDHAEEELKRLQAAVAAYGQKVGKEIGPLQTTISKSVLALQEAQGRVRDLPVLKKAATDAAEVAADAKQRGDAEAFALGNKAVAAEKQLKAAEDTLSGLSALEKQEHERQATARARIKEINGRAEVKPLLDAIAAISEGFGKAPGERVAVPRAAERANAG